MLTCVIWRLFELSLKWQDLGRKRDTNFSRFSGQSSSFIQRQNLSLIYDAVIEY